MTGTAEERLRRRTQFQALAAARNGEIARLRSTFGGVGAGTCALLRQHARERGYSMDNFLYMLVAGYAKRTAKSREKRAAKKDC